MADARFLLFAPVQAYQLKPRVVDCILRNSYRNRISFALCTTLLLQNASQAAAFEWFNSKQQQQEAQLVDKDPVEPFTIYGSIHKKYLIEQIVQGKVVARKKGFTASACMNILEASAETPELQEVPAGFKVTLIGDPCCRKAEGQSREDSCRPPCDKVCKLTIKRHLENVKSSTGYELDPEDQSRVQNSCFKQCYSNCLKPGKTISFTLPFRPRR